MYGQNGDFLSVLFEITQILFVLIDKHAFLYKFLHKNICPKKICVKILLEIDMFVGRKEEIRKLKELMAGDAYKAMMIFGRRRVGKTEIIKQALEGEEGIILHCECKKVLPSINLSLLEKEAKRVLGLPAYTTFSSYDDLFDAIFLAAKDQKIIFVIDEFSYLPLGGDDGVDASLARLIDLRKGDDLHLKLILSGSYCDLMQNIVDRSSPLHGHFDLIQEIHEFDYYDAAKFFPHYSPEEKFKAYAVFGGLPYALSLVNPSKSVEENIKDCFGVDTSTMMLLCQEMIESEGTKVASLNSVLNLVAVGKHKFSDLVAALGKDSRPEYALSKGVGLHFLTKVSPINDSQNKKLTYYDFDDNLLRFYFRYIFSNGSSISFMGKDLFYQEMVEPDFKKYYLPKAFERVSKDFLIRKNKAGEIKPPFFQIGTYSFNDAKNKKNLQFDVVTQDKNGFASYECKYTKDPIGMDTIHEEEKQTLQSPLPFYRLGYISRNGFTPEAKKRAPITYSLDEFYEERLDLE